MLVLTRKAEESFVIRVGRDARCSVAAGDCEIVVTVVEIKSSTIRVGIEAPRDVEIMRSEIILKGPGTHATNENQSSPKTAAASAAGERVTS